MSNLKTDDILGARPRIRHAPRNLIRDQKLAQQSPQSPYNYNHQYASYKPPFPEFQYQYPYVNNTRFYQRPEQPHDHQNYNQMPNYAASKEYRRRDAGSVNQVRLSESYYESPLVAGKSSSKIHSVNKTVDRYEQIKGNRPYILPKDAPVISYDSYQQPSNKNQPTTSYSRAFGGMDKQLYQKYQQNLNISRQLAAQSPPPAMSQEQKSKINTDNIEQREQREPREKRGSSRSVPSEERRYQAQENAEVERMEEKNKKIFRGLGYNIISNSKFEYDMQNRLKNSQSKWLN